MRYAVVGLVILLLAVVASSAFAQGVEFGSSMNPVGSGARAMGMGGAFIAVADDATAASWNPAGLIQLEKPEMSAVYSFFGRKQEYFSETHPEIEGINSMDAMGLNYASAAYPFVAFNRNVTVSLNFQRLFEMNKNIKFNYNFTDALGAEHFSKVDFVQTGGLYALSPAMAVQVAPGLYVGGTLNIWGKGLFKNGWNVKNKWSETGTTPSGIRIQNDYIEKKQVDFSGINGNLGLLWNVYGPLTIGAVYKLPFAADIRKDSKWTHITYENGIYASTYYDELHSDLTMNIPASYGIGFSYRHSDVWTVALDVYRTEWSHFWMTDEFGKKRNPLTGEFLSEGKPTDTTQIRLGSEYLFVKDKYVIPVRFGLFYDPEPATKSPDDYYGFSLGTGYATGRFAVDAAYQFRTGSKVDSDIAPAIKGSSADVRQHTMMLSVIYYFDK